MTFSIVIPTKNRPKELTAVFNSIMEQTRLPDQVIIIDQSKSENLVKTTIESLVKETSVILKYVHDEGIKGLVQAKAASLKLNECDFLSFFDDDIVLESNYLETIEKALVSSSNICGVNGVILNMPPSTFFKRHLFSLTHFGLYKDLRQNVLLSIDKNSFEPIPVNVLSGGLSTWRREVFENVSFDTKNMFHAYEDKEFSIRVGRVFPNQMYIVPAAKLYHYHSSGNRQSLLKRTMTDVVEVIMLFKKNGDFSYLGFDLLMLLFGLFLNSILLSFKYLNINFLLNYFKGIKEGIKRKIIG